MVGTELRVRSHVGRDLLQSAALFKHEHSVVWEYVSNGLEYKDPKHETQRSRSNRPQSQNYSHLR